MTARRASFFGLVGLVFAFWIAAIGCNLDTSGYGQSDGELCSIDAHCDDDNACTDDVCNPDGLCSHAAVPDGQLPDGIQGNCTIFECEGGVPGDLYFPADADDGNDCTADDCSPTLGATHDVTQGAPCDFSGGLGVCDADGACNAACGYIGDDGNEVGCDPSTNPCSPSYCDKSKGMCVDEVLDGVPVPGSPAPNDCGGSFCVAGQVKNLFAAASTACVGTTPQGTQGIVCDGMGACVECVEVADCNPQSHPIGFCFKAACVDNVCDVDVEADGTPLPTDQQEVGDCLLKVCFGAEVDDVTLDSDLPNDMNDCTTDACVAGTKVFTPLAEGATCGQNGALFCNAAGECSACVMASQCGMDTDCLKWACTNSTCQMNFVANDTPVPMGSQLAGNCLLSVCNGMGGTKNLVDDGDTPDDGNDCTKDSCAGGVQMFPFENAGFVCKGSQVCDAGGNCLGESCASSANCPNNGPCVDGVCCNSACNQTCEACTIGLKGGGLQGACGTSMFGSDNNDADCPGPALCNGTVGAMACKLPAGQPCSMGGQCLLGFCADGVCCNDACDGVCEACSAAGVCTPIPTGQDPANECPGVVTCSGMATCGNLLANGAVCSMGSECQSSNCIDSRCCNTSCNGTCQACNLMGSLGACMPIPQGQDPANECAGADVCNGAGECGLPTGASCAMPNDCATGFCTDGVCCNALCGGTCQACNLSGTGGQCSNVPAGQDPADECGGAASCGGNGTCALFGTGTPCAINGECASGFCVDGVCCGTLCNQTCRACNLPGSMGTCSLIQNGQDPSSECAGAQVCNGSGTCVPGGLGLACGAGAQCASGNCVDGVCCNNACGGACQACNLAGSTGTCTSVPANMDPASECTFECNGAGACELANGAICGSNAQCDSGHCVDGVCCNVACGGSCEACDIVNSVGTCIDVPGGTDIDNECPGNASCDGAGMCEMLPNGDPCQNVAGECASGNCVDGVCCNSGCTGSTCIACDISGSEGTCNAYMGTDPGDECAGALVCAGANTCKAAIGASCLVPSDCASNFCVDDVCCMSACTTDCFSCNSLETAAADGTCALVDPNTDPNDDCPGPQVCNGGACVTP